MRWLITRPIEEAGAMKRRLESLGHGAVISPMLRFVPHENPDIDWLEFDAVAFTSQRAVRAAAPVPPSACGLPVYSVGNATAAAARAAGFENVASARGNVADLAHAIEVAAAGSGLRVLHLAGEQQAADLSNMLTGSNASFVVIPVYRMEAATTFTPEALHALNSGALAGAIFLSPRTSEVFAKLASDYEIQPMAEDFRLVAISAATGEYLTGLGGSVQVARRPDLDHVLAMLDS